MKDNTPPRPEFDDDDELIYVGDADEVLNQWEQELNGKCVYQGDSFIHFWD